MANVRQSAFPAAPKVSTGKKVGYGTVVAMMLASVIAVEGGYVNNPNDPGGETNMGITKKVAEQNGYHGPMRQLPREVAESIYYKRYLADPGYEPLIALDAPVTEELFDTTVNMGPARPSKWFQQGLNELCRSNIAADGQVGPATVAAFNTCQRGIGATTVCVWMLNSLDNKQAEEYARLVRVNPHLKVFYKGWIAKRIGNVNRSECFTGR